MDLVEYKILVHIFGATSPSGATFALQKGAKVDLANEFGQEAAKTVKNNFYVNDCLKSTTDEKSSPFVLS